MIEFRSSLQPNESGDIGTMADTVKMPPGATIAEILKDRGIDKENFAYSVGLSNEDFDKFLHGETKMASDIALVLEISLGVPKQTWVSLQDLYARKVAEKIRWW